MCIYNQIFKTCPFRVFPDPEQSVEYAQEECKECKANPLSLVATKALLYKKERAK